MHHVPASMNECEGENQNTVDRCAALSNRFLWGIPLSGLYLLRVEPALCCARNDSFGFECYFSMLHGHIVEIGARID